MYELTYNSIKEMTDAAEKMNIPISELVINNQAEELEMSKSELMSKMDKRFEVMEEAVKKGLDSLELSASGLSGGDAARLKKYYMNGKTYMGRVCNMTMARALASAEQNAGMGLICAAPTAGSCGILPAVMITAMEELQIDRKKVIESLFTASAIGMVISNRASVSGADCGCQAECGSAAAMAACALTELEGGSVEMIAQACALTLKGMLGLVCDPVAGLVEVPCVKRNGVSAVHAIAASEMALAGIRSRIPADEVIDAMKEVGELMPVCLKETAKGGLATTDTAKKMAQGVTF